jgi:hypothetical protein
MGAYLTPLINGKSYEHADITMIILGVPMVGLTAVDYSEEAEITEVFATGRLAVSRTHGVVKATAKVTMLLEDVQNITNSISSGRLYDIPNFDIIVAFTDTDLIPVTHTIKNCKFKNNKISSSQGSDALTVELDIACTNIKWKL